MATGRSRIIPIVAVGGLLAAVPLSGASAAPHHSAARPHAVTPRLGQGGRVIVMLKQQTHPSGFAGMRVNGASRSAAAAAQNEVASDIRSSGGRISYRYSLINAIAAKVTQRQADALARNSAVAAVIPDAKIKTPSPAESPAAAAADANSGNIDKTGGIAPPPGTCPANPNNVQLEPEALSVTRADSEDPSAQTARSLGYDGSGVKVAFMAEGIDINNPDFQRDGHTIFSDYKDFSGDGINAPTAAGEAFLDASAIAAQGNQTYDISHFSDLPLNRPCKIRIEGEAPGVDLVGLKVFGNGYSLTSGFLEAIDYAVNVDHVDVLSQSFGSNPIPDTSQDAIRAADEAAVAAGVAVTVSTGDAGVNNTLGSPSTSPGVIGVGATTTYRFDLQTGYAAARFPGINGWIDNNISSLSSGGFNQSGGTVSLVAPGELNYAVCSTDLDMYEECADYAGDAIGVEASGGTSESAPTVAGVAALVIQAYRDGHDGASPTAQQIKDILTSSADDIDAPANQQGAGLVDAYKAVQLAKSYGPDGTPTGSVIRSSATHFSAVGKASTSHSFTDTITNDGATPETVNVTSRALGAYTKVGGGTVTLSDADSPKYVDFQGLPDNYGTVNFTVPANADRLEASIAFQAPGLSLASRVRMTLVDPNGDLAAYSLPQGIGNFGHVEVAKPVAGKWTAIITSRTSDNGGTEGPVKFAAAVANYKPWGSVSPSTLTLAPGKSGKVHLTVKSSSTPGDTAGSLVLGNTAVDAGGVTPAIAPDTAATTVPVTLRSLIPAGSHKYTETLTGGNGRDEFPGVLYYFQTDVPKGTPELNATVSIGNPANGYEAALITPGGNMAAFASNTVLTTYADSGPSSKQVRGVQLHVLKPAAGRWTEIIDFAPTVSGTTLSTPFTIGTSDTKVKAKATGLPNSTKKAVAKGKVMHAFVSIRNNGPSPESYFLDPRLNKTASYDLASITGSDTEAPIDPSAGDPIPTYIVPTHTTDIAETAVTNGSEPIQFDSEGPLGDPDIVSNQGKSVSANYAGNPVSPGPWDIAPQAAGPFTDAATEEPVATDARVQTRAFDTKVTSSTGDLWLGSVDPNAELNAVTVQPGQTAVIQVTIKAAKPGTFHGTLFIDDADLVATTYSTFISPDGNEVAALPYAFRVRG